MTDLAETNQRLGECFDDIQRKWDSEITPLLEEFISIPNKSVMFDPDWKAHGYMDQAVKLMVDWCEQQPIKGMQLEVIEEPGRTPLIYMDIPGQNDDTILLYGHLDKQPEMVGWDEDKGPWKPVLIGDKLYGRGGADDGYAVFSALTAISTLQANDIPHSRCVVVIEASEESGSVDLVHYLKQLTPRIGSPSLIIALDSGCGNYEQMWNTTSLRGILGGSLTVKVAKEGVHSGQGSGVIPGTMMIMRELMDRIEDHHTGKILPEFLHVDIPQQRIEQAKQAAEILGDEVVDAYAWHGNTKPMTSDATDLLLNRTWRSQVAITGADGLPPIADAGNVTLPEISFKLSVRLAPTLNPEAVIPELKALLENDAPYGATVEADFFEHGPGWNAPAISDWLADACDKASETFYGKPAAYHGEGGSIPFMGMLGDIYPEAQFLITGVLGPHSNAHGPNEFIHLPMAKKLTGCVASVIAAHHIRD
ncbi:MAG: M20 family metallopeptidase [Coxiellaceae bacterium]|nr:M20 family metallopeptidase [Coxiellaceae bacterium]